jgi:hypothetical protein
VWRGPRSPVVRLHFAVPSPKAARIVCIEGVRIKNVQLRTNPCKISSCQPSLRLAQALLPLHQATCLGDVLINTGKVLLEAHNGPHDPLKVTLLPIDAK